LENESNESVSDNEANKNISDNEEKMESPKKKAMLKKKSPKKIHNFFSKYLNICRKEIL